MRNNRILSLLLALCLCFGMTVTASAAGTALKVQAPETLPAVGKTFEVTVSISGNPGLGAVQYTLGFDKTAVTCTRVKLGELLEGTVSATNPAASDGARIAAATVDPVEGDGVLATYTFKVLKQSDAKLVLKDVILDMPAGKPMNPSVHITGGQASSGAVPPVSGGAAEQPEQPPVPETPVEEETVTLPQTFTDVPESYWAAAQIQRAADKGLISGYADGSFRPGNSVTRAQFVTMLWRMAGKPAASGAAPFADTVSLNADFRAAIAWAAENGYVNGVTATAFAPNNTITRQQAMAILFRYNGSVSGMELMFGSMYDSQYTDSGTVGAFAKPGVYWAIYNGIVNGTTPTTIAPHGTATRAQIAVILLRYMDKFE